MLNRLFSLAPFPRAMGRRFLVRAMAVALALGVSVACAPKAMLSPVSPPVPAAAGEQSVKVGAVSVPLHFPARSTQFAYQSGYINAIEVMLVDSLGQHQAYLVCRNLAQVGSQGGTVNLLFQHVALGTAWVTVRTTTKQFIGSSGRLTPVSGLPSTFTLDGGPTTKVAVLGDVGSAVVVFNSHDLGGTAMNPSVLSYYSSNDGASELNDTSATLAGYGVGAASGSVTANSTTPINIFVTQPPRFGSPMYSRQVDAGGAITFAASDVVAGDRAVVVRSGNPSATSDFLDLSKTQNVDFYPLTSNGDGTYTFTPTRATGGSVNFYLARGEAVSLLGGSSSNVSLAQVNVHPAAIHPASCSVRIGSDDGTSTFARSVGQTDMLYLTLKDRYGNLVTDSHFGARAMEGFVWYPTMEPLTSSLNNGVNPQAFIPGATLGSLSTPTYNAGDGTWRSTFTQGTLTPSSASASFTVSANTNISGVNYLYDPSNLTATGSYILGVMADPTIVSTPQRLWLSLYRGTAINTGTFVASVSYSPSAAPAAAGATVSITPTTPSGYPLILKLNINPSSDLAVADNGTKITVLYGARTVGDSDRALFRLYKQNSDGSLLLQGSIQGGLYSWK